MRQAGGSAGSAWSPTRDGYGLGLEASAAVETCGCSCHPTTHPNACLTCDDFLTDFRYLDAHRDQLNRTRKLIATADASGNFRMVEMNRQVETNLSRLIEAIERRKEAGGDRRST